MSLALGVIYAVQQQQTKEIEKLENDRRKAIEALEMKTNPSSSEIPPNNILPTLQGLLEPQII